MARFSDFVTLQRGFDLPKADMREGTIPVIGSTSIIGYHDEFKAEPPGVVTGRSGSLGTVQFIDERYWPHNTSLWVKDFKGNDPRFVYYRLQVFDFARFNAGAGVPTLNRNHLDSLELEIPSLATQKRIASILSAYDDLIENNTRRIAMLEEMARRIYEEWFVRFRFPGHEGVQMVESDLGPAPEGWSLVTVADVTWVHRGRSYKGSELADSGGKPLVNLKCIERDGGFRASGLKRYTGIFKDSQTVRDGEIVMAVTDMTQERRIVARAGRVTQLGGETGVISMDLVRIATNGQMPEAYLYAMFRWSGFADEVKQHANGANVLHLHPSRIEDYKFVCPPKSLADRYSDVVSPMLSLCDTLGQKNTNLRATRDLLLPKLISGELDVSELPAPEAIAA